MKYTKRELKAFNVFALFLFGLGGLFLAFGLMAYAAQPVTRFSVAEAGRVSATVEQERDAGASGLPGDVEDGPLARRQSFGPQTRVVEAPNLQAISKALIGLVFILMSIGLNAMLLRVMRRGGEDGGGRRRPEKKGEVAPRSSR